MHKIILIKKNLEQEVQNLEHEGITPAVYEETLTMSSLDYLSTLLVNA